MQEESQVMENFLARGRSILSLVEQSAEDGLVACQEEVKGQWRVGTKRLLPKAETRVAILARAIQAPGELTRRASEMRDSLKSMCESLGGLGVELPEEEKDSKSKVKKIKTEAMDPTTYRATARKILGDEGELQLNLEFARDNLTRSKPGTSRDMSGDDSTKHSRA